MDTELGRALLAAAPFPFVAPHVERAAALARFEMRDPQDGPFWRGPLSPGVPQPPARPLFPALARVPETPLTAALEALQHELVWAADGAEYTDATNNAAQYLRAAGHVDLAQRAALALAGPGLGLVLAPPALVRELAAGLGLRLEDLLGAGEVALGSLPPTRAGIDASFRWDMYHEAPVTSPDHLGSRELTSYSVRFTYGRTECEAAASREFTIVAEPESEAFTLAWAEPGPEPAPALALDTLAERLHAEAEIEFAALPARAVARALGVPDAIARTYDVHMSSWYLATPDGGRITLGGRVVEARLDDSARGESVAGLRLPAAAARHLHEDDRVSRVRAEPR